MSVKPDLPRPSSIWVRAEKSLPWGLPLSSPQATVRQEPGVHPRAWSSAPSGPFSQQSSRPPLPNAPGDTDNNNAAEKNRNYMMTIERTANHRDGRGAGLTRIAWFNPPRSLPGSPCHYSQLADVTAEPQSHLGGSGSHIQSFGGGGVGTTLMVYIALKKINTSI